MSLSSSSNGLLKLDSWQWIGARKPAREALPSKSPVAIISTPHINCNRDPTQRLFISFPSMPRLALPRYPFALSSSSSPAASFERGDPSRTRWPNSRSMATEVTSLLRIMEEAESKQRDLFTRDLLGGGGGGVAAEESAVDLDLQVPSGWERHLDLMSGKTYLHKMDSDCSLHGFHDLNLPPPSSSSVALPENSAFLDLKLAGSDFGGGGRSRGDFQSVCTLEKVKSALERAGRAEAASSASASPSSSTTSTSMKRRSVAEEDDGRSDSTGGMMAAACPSCLLYVLVSKANPRCPRCDSHVPLAFIPKKHKFDLNSS
ncbi:hypothetical protein IEQ34_012410 [Dendrobium chrysotoxum]|uniref:GIR1-like zinc ribbon domain-containing protein n=1 Tax=Dendrobium chrysotoxum TaxID=161865 RepID=A0AAV7GSF6_DENCH|nr:hypothetical protein IEQ34_012410 [Dendrobium chrysotoxum]